MSSGTFIAIISGSLAIVAAIISSIFVLLSNRKASKYQKELEKYKSELELISKSQSLKREDILERAKALGDACTHIQQIRDNIRKLLISKPANLELINEIRQNNSNLIRIYQEKHYILSGLERKILHDVKTLARYIDIILTKYLNNPEEYLPKLKDLKQLLEIFHSAQELLIIEHKRWKSLLQGIPQSELGEEKYFSPKPGQNNYLLNWVIPKELLLVKMLNEPEDND